MRALKGKEAGVCWGDMKKAEVARLGRSLADQPEEIASKLAGSSAGCDWLIARWVGLGKVLEKNGDWTESQAHLALDLLGVAADLRELDNPLEAPEGVARHFHLREIIGDELEALHARKEAALDEVDDNRREAAAVGLIDHDDPGIMLLRRYETACARRQKWAVDMLHKGRQRAEPIARQTRDYRERSREPYTYLGEQPLYDTPPTDRPPHTDPSGPDGGGQDRGEIRRQDPGHSRIHDHRRESAAPVPQAKLGRNAGRTQLLGHLLRLARSLAASRTSKIAPKPVEGAICRPVGRMSRPSPAAIRPLRGNPIRLLSDSAA